MFLDNAKSLKRKMFLVLITGSITTLIAAFTITLILEFNVEKRDLKISTKKDVALLSRIYAHSFSNEMDVDNEIFDNYIQAHAPVAHIILTDANGKTIFEKGDTLQKKQYASLIGKKEFVEENFFFYRVYEPIYNKIHLQGWIILTISYKNLYMKMISFSILLLVICTVLILISIYLINKFQKRITEPIAELSNFTEKIQYSKDYSLRIETSRKDEIGILFKNFNNLMEQISNRELERDLAEEEIRESEKRYRYLAELLPQPIFETDFMGNITYINQIGYLIFNVTQNDVETGINLNDLIETDKDIIEIAEIGENLKFTIHKLDVLGKKKMSENFPASIHFSSIVRHDLFIGVRCVVSDISERFQFEQELQNAKIKAEQSDKLKSAFLANMSHEIRTPMNSIIGFADMLNDQNLTQQEKTEYISFINNSGKLLLNLIDDIIDIAKIEAGQIQITKKQFDLNYMLFELQQSVKEEIKKHLDKSIRVNFITPTVGSFFIINDPVASSNCY